MSCIDPVRNQNAVYSPATAWMQWRADMMASFMERSLKQSFNSESLLSVPILDLVIYLRASLLSESDDGPGLKAITSLRRRKASCHSARLLKGSIPETSGGGCGKLPSIWGLAWATCHESLRAFVQLQSRSALGLRICWQYPNNHR